MLSRRRTSQAISQVNLKILERSPTRTLRTTLQHVFVHNRRLEREMLTCCLTSPSDRSQGQAENAGSTLLAYQRLKLPMATTASVALYTTSMSTTARLVLCRWGRVLEPPLSPPNLRCHYTGKERYRQNHCLTAEAHARPSSRNPFELEVDNAEATSRPTEY